MEKENQKQKEIIKYLIGKNKKIQKRKNEYKLQNKDMEKNLEKVNNQNEALLVENTEVWKKNVEITKDLEDEKKVNEKLKKKEEEFKEKEKIMQKRIEELQNELDR